MERGFSSTEIAKKAKTKARNLEKRQKIEHKQCKNMYEAYTHQNRCKKDLEGAQNDLEGAQRLVFWSREKLTKITQISQPSQNHSAFI